jgi:Mrp family chromosome partitioning ATPase
MNTRQQGSPQPPPASAPIKLHDIYYTLFRHKWMIAILVALGVGSALAIHWLWPFPYISQAELFIRYIQDISDPTSMDGTATRLKSPDDRGANILNTELKVLTSADIYEQVATNIGPGKIMAKPEESNNVNAAVVFIGNHFKAEVANNSDVILLSYSGNDPEVVQPVLIALIAAYKKRYLEIHMTPGFTDQSLQEQIDIAKGRLAETMQTFEALKAELGIIALSDATKNVADQLAKTEEGIFQTQAEMAETEATIKDLQERIPNAATNTSSAIPSNANTTAAQAAFPSPEVVAKYQNLNFILSTRRVREQELESQFTTSNKLVQNAEQQRDAAEADVKQYEEQNPGLIAIKQKEAGAPGNFSAGQLVADPLAMLRDAVTKEHGLRARFIELTNQLDLIKTNAVGLNVGEGKILQAQTEMDVAQRKYEHLRLAAEQSRINDAVGNKVSNISTVEQPTPPARDPKQILKVTGGVLGFFLVLAFGLPFLIEKFLDQSFKQPFDVQAKIAAPFFITFPRTNGHGKLAALKRANPGPLLSTEDQAVTTSDLGQVAPWDQRHELRPFFETLRDRLMTYFEMINLTHKPKLVAVTSCGSGAGVTTTAAGLASSLSEIGEGNVLLVNMNVGDGEAHHFYKGKLNCGLEEALAAPKPEQAQVNGHLYIAKEMESDDKLPRVLPKRFSHLVPMMKASDYDYIIFDMPPVTEISITPRLARFMDMVLLVVESEKTPRDAVVRTAALLAETKTNVGLVLNKNRSYLPKRLTQGT